MLCSGRGEKLIVKGSRYSAWRPRGLSKWVISRVISTLNGVALIVTLLITDLLSPLTLQVGLDCPTKLAVQGPRLYYYCYYRYDYDYDY